jgi:hypothetical protein
MALRQFQQRGLAGMMKRWDGKAAGVTGGKQRLRLVDGNDPSTRRRESSHFGPKQGNLRRAVRHHTTGVEINVDGEQR